VKNGLIYKSSEERFQAKSCRLRALILEEVMIIETNYLIKPIYDTDSKCRNQEGNNNFPRDMLNKRKHD
jgi:hypothetical protein